MNACKGRKEKVHLTLNVKETEKVHSLSRW